MAPIHNFNPGPAVLPLPALTRARDEFLDVAGSGMSIMEHSHRAKVYEGIHNEAIALLRELCAIPGDYEVLLLQGGASQQFAVVPMNLLDRDKSADYVVTGTWSQKALKEARCFGRPRVAATTEVDGKFYRVPSPDEIDLDPDAAYVHITTNNTIAGTQFHEFPQTSAPLVADMSSDIMSGPLDVTRFGLIYAGAQKNLGPSGVTVVIVRKDLVEAGRRDIPAFFQYRTHAADNSLSNTPPTFAIYMLRNVLSWLKEQGGLPAIAARNHEKARLLYDVLDERSDFYVCRVEKRSRSSMNVVFNLPTPELEAECISAAQQLGMVGLKGHRLVGGLRASIYNACPQESVAALADFLRSFKK
ncbi:MAG TPA: 3-phosphoserine/phosphohydroxythreonine transaminase [Polyangiaceae bacterium]